jgi:hypothetical protein
MTGDDTATRQSPASSDSANQSAGGDGSNATAYGNGSPFQALGVARLRTRMQEQFELSDQTMTIEPRHFYASVHAAVDACVCSRAAPA